MEDTVGIGLGYRSQHPAENVRVSSSSFAPFVQGQTQVATVPTKQPDGGNDETARQQQPPNDTPIQNKQEESNELALVQERAEQGRLRAQAILRRFQEQQDALLQLPQLILTMSDEQQQQQAPSVYVEQRRKAAVRERRRLSLFFSKNFAYLAAKQDSETQEWEQKIAAAQQREVEAEQHYQRILEERKQKRQQKELQSQAGIGTHKRKRAEVTKASLSKLPSVALYVSGIPRDGSIQANSLGDIFRAYGTVTKVHYYRDKATGELKGDGLVVFEVQNMQEGGNLLQMCAQMNGAEIAEGVVLHAEPAASSAQEIMAPVMATESQIATEKISEDNQDEDLDDFFDSL